jgi:hypothetical protein
MLRTLCTVATVALLAGGAFAQSNTAPSSQSQNAPAASQPADAAPAPAAADNSAANSGSTEGAKPAKMHRHHRMHASRGGRASDWDADKLNACQADANPTPQQLDCMRNATNARS